MPAPPKPKPIFMPTQPDKSAQHKIQPIESANDTNLRSTSKVARDPNSIMPDVTGKPKQHDLTQTQQVQAPPTPQISSAPPTPRHDQPTKPAPPQPKPQEAKQPSPQPSPKPVPPPPKPVPKPPPVDENGLPVLPPINAQTMTQQDPTLVSPPPSPSLPTQLSSVHGALGTNEDLNSPAAMKTALGKYKAQVYYAVGSRWYPKIDSAFGLIGAGEVRVQFTIFSNGTVETKVLEGGNSTLQQLLSISVNSIREAAPFDPFPPEMVQELIQQQGGDGSSYTDDFTFSVY
jgi:outer membrane biosynthesis protein TonB